MAQSADFVVRHLAGCGMATSSPSTFFHILQEFASAGGFACKFLAEQGVVGTLLRLFMDSNEAAVDDDEGEGEGELSMPWASCLGTVAAVLQASAGAASVRITPQEQELLRSEVLYKRAWRSLHGAAVAPLVAFGFQEQEEWSIKASEWLCRWLNKEATTHAQREDVMHIVRAMLTLPDSLQLRRIAWVVGDMCMGNVAAGSGLGLPHVVQAGDTLVDNTGPRTATENDFIIASAERRQELKGVTKGLLDVVLTYADQDMDRVFPIVMGIIEVAATEEPKVAEYLGRMDAANPAAYDRFMEYFYIFLRDYIVQTKTRDSDGAPIPVAVRRRQRAMAAFPLYEKVLAQAKADAPWVSQFSPRHKKLHEVLSLGRGRLDSWSGDKASEFQCCESVCVWQCVALWMPCL